MKCLVCLKNSVHADNYSILLFLAPPLWAQLFWWGNQFPPQIPLPIWTDCSQGKGVGWVICHFSIINPLFNQSVKISQFTCVLTVWTSFMQGMDWVDWSLEAECLAWGHKLSNTVTKQSMWQAQRDGIHLQCSCRVLESHQASVS